MSETALRELLDRRIAVLDGAWGTMLQGAKLTPEDYQGDRFGDHFAAVLGYSSVLVDGRRWPDPAAPVPDGAELALLPPFSGGA